MQHIDRPMDPQNSPEITLTNVSFLSRGLIEKNVNSMASHMNFYAIFNIVIGVLMSLSIVGALIGVPVIIYHLKLNESAQSFKRFAQSSDFFHLHKAFEKQRKFFLFYKIYIIIMMILFVIYIGVIIYIVSWGLMQFPQNFT